ncbi:MAG TPA: DNA mismatch repair protein MutS [Clostridiales bacterium]|nr:DNA mismatch repair protein MutS [Clostridiales bacterium]
MAELTPMMRQYLEIKDKYKDCILFFRLGDFYEMFFEDAKIASEELDLTLTGRDCGQEERAPMCGVPYHSCEAYIARLISKGYRVAICEQVEDPATAKGLVKREVVRVITPGTVIEDSMLDESKNNFLAAISILGNKAGMCFVDASTGTLNLTEFDCKGTDQRIIDELGRFNPSEILADEGIGKRKELVEFIENRLSCRITKRSEEDFDPEKLKEVILSHFMAEKLDNLGLKDGSAAVSALGAALKYLYETQRTGLLNINDINFYEESQFMRLDLFTIRNLELLETMRNKEKRGSLLWVLDKTKTAMGKRRIRTWIEQPLISIPEIEMRLNAVDEIAGDTILRGEILEQLAGIHDLERLMTRIVYGTAGARELKSLSSAISRLPQLKALLQNVNSRLLKEIYENIDLLEDVYNLIESAIIDQPPATIREGGIIKEGYNSEVDQLRDDINDTKGVLARIENQEKERTGIKTLKVRYNKVFGYYIEVTNSYKSMVPPDYIRKQTLTNCERFITEELKNLESRILGAKDRIVQLEYELFEEIRKQVANQFERVQSTASAVAVLDVLCSFAETAVKNNYCRPKLNNEGRIYITNGRHPVVEATLKTPFVPNDTILDNKDNRCIIITGPNMAGKSTYMRQVALICLMAQMGSFVPAQSADLCIVDAIFTRVGASDDLSAGQSTFMVEMSEVAYILKNATSKSLLILDEIGRGTSTYDGMSIARAVLEYVSRKICAKTMFATHYHELTVLEGQIEGVKNYNIAVKKRGDEITFLRRIVRGGADRSYGIEVGKLAGIPDAVIERAKEILKLIEKDGVSAKNTPYGYNLSADEPQVSFEMQTAKLLADELKRLDVNTLTPIEAMTKLFELVNKARNL